MISSSRTGKPRRQQHRLGRHGGAMVVRDLSQQREVEAGEAVHRVRAAVRLAKKESPDSIAKALNLPLNKLNNGTRDVPALFVEPTPVTGENILNVIVKERLYPMDKVYANVPKDQWPKKY